VSHHRNPIAAAALVAAAVLALATPAAASAFQTARFYVTARGQQTTSWNLPYFIDSSSCYDKHWTSGSGHESFSFRSPRTKLRISSFDGADTTWSYGSWSSLGGRDVLDATGTWTAQRSVEGGEIPGKCGGGTSPDPAPLQDCGTRHVSLGMSFDPTQGEHRELLIAEQIERPAMRCPELVGMGASQEFTGISALVPRRELFGHRIGKEIILAHQRFVFHAQPSQRPGSATTTTQWTLTLTRAR
jgi:hypothetical protein